MAFVHACLQGEVQAFGACSSAAMFHAIPAGHRFLSVFKVCGAA